MSLHATLDLELAREATERVAAIGDTDRPARRSSVVRPDRPGRYIEIEWPDETVIVALHQGITHIGRGLSADVHLDDTSVSRRHAILINRRSALLIDDRSANGTLVNGRPIERAELHDGDVLALGHVVLRFLDV